MEMAKLMLDNGADINISEGYAVRLASMLGSTEMVSFLVENGASLKATESGTTALHAAAMNARADTANTLISFGVDVNSYHLLLGTPLHFACSKVADEMIARDSDKHEMVFDSSHDRSLEDTAHLLLAEVDELVNDSLLAGLRKEVSAKRLALVRLLIEKNADVNALRAGGISVLHDALERDDRQLVDFLISKGATLDQERKETNTEEIKKCRAGTDDDDRGSNEAK